MNGWWIPITSFLLAAVVLLLYLLFRQRSRMDSSLRELSRQLESVKEEKNQLGAFVSHDFKSPLNRIFALVQIMSRSEGLPADQKDLLAKMHQVIADMLLTIRNLQDDRKLSQGNLSMHFEEVNLSAIVGSVIKNFRLLMDSKHLALDAAVPPHIAVKADRHYLTRVIENIFSNAVKFSPPGKTIAVRLQAGEPPRLEVLDEGPGIAVEDMGGLFKKFTALTAKPTGSESAAGLGLFIAKALSEKMGFDLQCERSEKGALFSLRLNAQPS